MRKKLYEFSYGRYGTDQLSIFLIIFYFLLRTLSLTLHATILIYLAVPAVVFAYYRIFSRNISARQQENQKYLQYTAPYWDKFNFFIHNLRDKEHRYFRCPKCRQRLRVPRNKGTVKINCSKCNCSFQEKT